MTSVGIGNIIYNFRQKIQALQLDLEKMGDPTQNMPELIESANLLRSNEYLKNTNEKKSEILSVYVKYSDALEDLIETTFDIQNDLKNLLQEQSNIISRKKSRKKLIPKRNSSKRKLAKRPTKRITTKRKSSKK